MSRRRLLPGGRAALLAAVLVVVAVEVLDATWTPGPWPRYPELDEVDADLVRALRPFVLDKGIFHAADDERATRLREIAVRHGAASAPAILRLMLERYAGADPGTDSLGFAFRDEQWAPAACLMGELAGAELRPALLRAAADGSLHPGLRRLAVIALCRPRHAAALDALVDLALDRYQSKAVRRAVLLRLHRVGRPPPARLKELLYQPFAYLDRITAGTLARMGDFEAPTLVRDGLRRCWWDTGITRHLAQAVDRITGETRRFGDNPPRGREREYAKARAERFAAALEKWLAAHPEAQETGFERGRRKPRPVLGDFEDILAAGERVDVAAASMLLAGYEGPARAYVLDELDRLAKLLRRRLGPDPCADPERTIGILNRTLLGPRRNVDYEDHRSGRISFLPALLRNDYGNCLGYTTLYLALADRLDLPLVPVGVPGHCFVRWDDGRLRRNIETTAGGVEKPDASYGHGDPLPAASRRQLLVWVMSNHDFTLAKERSFDKLEKDSGRILRLDPRNVDARLMRARAILNGRLGPDADADVRRDLAAALRLGGERPEVLGQVAELRLALGDVEPALAVVREALRLHRTADLVALEALCLARAGRAADALASLSRARAELGDGPALRGATLAAGILGDPGSAAERAGALARKTGDALDVHSAAASVLLEIGDRQAARDALALLDDVSAQAGRTWKQTMLEQGLMADPDTYFPIRRRYHLLRAKALGLLGFKADAWTELDRARGLGSGGRLQLEVEALLAK